MPIAPTPGYNLSSSTFTHKEWIVPPRPKPGRKPAGDAPPTKRKAQNREAQRAFRERRAAKVGELEEQLKGLEEESQRDNEHLKNRVDQLQYDLQQCTEMLSKWQRRYEELEVVCRRESQLRQQSEMEVNFLRSGMTAQTEAVTLPPRRGKKHILVDQIVQAQEPNATANAVTCGRCSNSSRCQCIEEAFEMADYAVEGGNASTGKRLHSPSADGNKKRMCQDRVVHQEENEIDFTTQLSNGRPNNSTSNSFVSVSAPDRAALERCGFCNDGSECICAALTTQPEQQSITPTPEIESTQRADAIQTTNNLSTSCTNNPGTCAQCRSDPSSTFFCKTLAATRRDPASEDSKVATKTADFTQADPDSVLAAAAEPTLSCADAFSTLSRHHAYPQASAELGSWVTQLTAVPGIAKTEGKTAFEIEAASVMSVLKFFDSRFGESSQAAATNRFSKEHTNVDSRRRASKSGDVDKTGSSGEEHGEEV